MEKKRQENAQGIISVRLLHCITNEKELFMPV